MSVENPELNVLIRKAEKNDMKAVIGLIKELAAFEKLEHQVKIDYSILEKDGFSGDGRPYFECIVAELPNTTNIVGYALYFYSYSTWEGKAIFLEDLYVKVAYRQQGVGKKLFLAVMKTAYDSGIRRVDFHVLAWNSAIDFYKRMGATDLSESEEWKLFRMNHTSLKKLFTKLGLGKKLFLAVMKAACELGLECLHLHASVKYPATNVFKRLGAISLSEIDGFHLVRMNHASMQKLFS